MNDCRCQEGSAALQLCSALLNSSIAEIEVIVGVSIVLTLAKHRADKVEGAHGQDDATPDLESVVNEDAIDEESLEATVHEMEEPLLCRV